VPRVGSTGAAAPRAPRPGGTRPALHPAEVSAVTRSLISLPPLVLALLTGAPAALAQDVPTPPPTPPMCAPESIQDEEDGSGEARTLSHVDGVGASTSMSVTKQGDAWQIELEKVTLADAQGVASEQKVIVLVKSDHTVDEGLDALFREAPDDPAEWERRIEQIARIQLDLAQPDPALTKPLFEQRDRAENWFQELRSRWEAWEREFKDEVRRWRRDGDGCYGRCHGKKGERAEAPKGRLYY
jgi:hypothetical protein